MGPDSVIHRHKIFCGVWPGVNKVGLDEAAHFVPDAEGTAEKTQPPQLLARRGRAWSRGGDR